MKNEKLLYSIGNISDKYISEAMTAGTQPGASKVVSIFRKPMVIAAVVTICLLMCAFTVYVMTGGDLWIQKPSYDPVKTVRSALENQVGKDYTMSIEVESVEIDEAETQRVVERLIKGAIAQWRGWSDAYLAEHFVVVKAVYYAEDDRTQTTRSDGEVVQYFYLAQDVESGKWTIVDNSGNVNPTLDLAGEKEADTGEDTETESVEKQIFAYLSGLFTKVYRPYYDGLHYEMTDYRETIANGKVTATFLWTMYHLGKGWDVGSDEGVETQANFSLQATAAINDSGALDLSTISILADSSAVGAPVYSIPIEDFFPNQLAD